LIILSGESILLILFFGLGSDMLLIDEFDIESYMSDCVIAGLPQVRKHIKYYVEPINAL
jgi:hypothetical protein